MAFLLWILEPPSATADNNLSLSLDTYTSGDDTFCIECKEPCHKLGYEPSLSYATLSSLKVRTLTDNEKFKDVSTGYANARELEQRITGQIFSLDLEYLTGLNEAYAEV